MDCRGCFGAAWRGPDRICCSEHSKGSDQVLRSNRAHSPRGDSPCCGNNRSAYRPRGGNFSDYSTPAVRSAALETGERSRQRSFQSLITVPSRPKRPGRRPGCDREGRRSIGNDLLKQGVELRCEQDQGPRVQKVQKARLPGGYPQAIKRECGAAWLPENLYWTSGKN